MADKVKGAEIDSVREKLIELMFEGQVLADAYCDKQDECDKCLHNTPNGCRWGAIADHLIANGVIVGKPLTEYLHPVDGYEGLKGKYLVFKADSGEQVTNCFVLRPDKDTSAVEALRAYANNTANQTLAEDIHNWVGKGGTVQKWIPVTERLPEKDGCYIVTACDEGCSCGDGIWYDTVVVEAEYYKGEWAWNENGTEYDISCFVTHWMPLPEPPKGE